MLMTSMAMLISSEYVKNLFMHILNIQDFNVSQGKSMQIIIEVYFYLQFLQNNISITTYTIKLH